MMSETWSQELSRAFLDNVNLQIRILDAARQRPDLQPLFLDIARYVVSTSPQSTQLAQSRKRKLEDSGSNDALVQNGSASAGSVVNPTVAFECNNVSFQVPARKKLKLELVVEAADTSLREIRLRDSKSNDIEHILSSARIDQIFCLPVPEKQQRQWNFCVFPQVDATLVNDVPMEQMVFTLNETKPVEARSTQRTPTDGDNYVTFTEHELNDFLQPYGKRVIRPDENEFASSIPQSHRKGEKAYHVKAHKGTKEGFLFFLPNGIVFGFKKPLSFFPFSSIESISYTSVLQRTFNLVVAVMQDNLDAGAKEEEFSMLDQADFAGIDDYIKRHGLNDASMAAQRKAKAYNVNKERKAEANGSGAHMSGEDEQSELQKAEQQLQDEEDEEEEDYEASGGESDGEGEDTDDEEEEGYGEEYGEEEDEGEGMVYEEEGHE